MTANDPERAPTSLDDETPGSQGEIESGSEGDFTGPENLDEPADEEPPIRPDEAADASASAPNTDGFARASARLSSVISVVIYRLTAHTTPQTWRNT